MSKVLTAVFLSAGLLVCGCQKSCPPQLLVAFFAPDHPALTHKRSAPWQSQLNLLPASDNGSAWTAAIDDATAAPARLGVIAFSTPGSTLTLGLPFPLTTGQTLALTADQQTGVASFSFLPAASGPTAWLDPCVGTSETSCTLTSGETVTGALRVDQSTPLGLRIDATFSDGAGSTSVVIGGVVTFGVVPESCSGGSWGPRISG